MLIATYTWNLKTVAGKNIIYLDYTTDLLQYSDSYCLLEIMTAKQLIDALGRSINILSWERIPIVCHHYFICYLILSYIYAFIDEFVACGGSMLNVGFHHHAYGFWLTVCDTIKGACDHKTNYGVDVIKLMVWANWIFSCLSIGVFRLYHSTFLAKEIVVSKS